MGLMTLDQIAIKNGADKGSTHPVKGHDFARHYDQAFRHIRLAQIRVLEIGCGGGESMRMWLEYFENAFIFGVDIVEKTNPWNTPGTNVHPRYQFLQGNQSDPVMWQCLFANWGKPFDIVIDDGSHMSDDVNSCLIHLWPAVRSGGYYCIEDLGCSYSSIFQRSPKSPMDVLIDKLNPLHIGYSDIDSIYFAQELAIIRKR